MNKTYLLLGSNMGNSRAKLATAITHIEKKIGSISRCSSIYQTAAWGNTNQPDFLNQVIVVETKLPATTVMQTILTIEEKMGRIRTMKNAARIIDIDILFFNDEIIREQELVIPHPLIQERRFVLQPMTEIAPSYIHPVLGKSMLQLLEGCPDKSNIEKQVLK